MTVCVSMCLPVRVTEICSDNNIIKDNIFRTSPHFLTKHSKVLHHHQPEVRAEKTKQKRFAIFMVKVKFKIWQKHSATLAAWSSNGKIMSKLKNGRIIRVDIDMDINAVFKKGLSYKGSEDDSVTGK